MLVVAVIGGAKVTAAGGRSDMVESAAMFHGLSMIIQCKGPMQQCILKAQVAENGGKVVEAGEDANIVCCEADKKRDEILSLRFGECSGAELEGRLQKEGVRAVSVKWLYACLKQKERIDWNPFILVEEEAACKGKEEGASDKVCGKRRKEEDQGKEGDQEERVQQKAVKLAPIFGPKKTAKDLVNDKQASLLMWKSCDFQGAEKIAAFDLDGTLIRTKSRKKFPQNFDDWCLIRPSILKPKLQSLVKDGFCIVIISNQKRIDKNPDYEAGVEHKISSIHSALGCPLIFFACYGSDENRKPAPGMWFKTVEKMKELKARSEPLSLTFTRSSLAFRAAKSTSKALSTSGTQPVGPSGTLD
ncbi:hypothetical protein GUITHDRAFT_139612 [Guillardia theta CCMP2712]|uniref:BRCT domain-containing protein n=1 Tax=Guillardia theta (strain CCMP2712) TaxID=905079 RepID=L1J829_GUITC|nr:hypothetical protein GUITHDRAFT_139612 [Guillardia theta CCMP2712]EKX44686.1 hypothetical protein GUITHDRAFT_139612 [Guillardia theta CCMP2712]|eukprot:XP_005831666.1 hypothetical protein GUITHDRAFT_139612 [Guillardia theta CCMP2712]